MTYDPATFWKHRKVPSEGISPDLEAYIKKHIEGAGTVLDFGVGTGRLLPLYGQRKVDMFDLIPRLPNVITKLDDLGEYDVTIVSKVLLHIPPRQIRGLITRLQRISKKVVVYDTHAEMTAEHCFTHDFSKWGEMKDVRKEGDNLYFVYEC